jgi:hypothetical protein
MEQVTSHVMMIRPAAFGFNAETALNNTFQTRPDDAAINEVTQQALSEFDGFVELLRKEGVDVTVVDDSASPTKPDAVFPNNWISFHEDGTVITYPMYSSLRRNERREDVVSDLQKKFSVEHVIRLEEYEEHDQFLEGTGSLVLDRMHKVAYACLSERTDPNLFEQWCEEMLYIPVAFHAFSGGKPIYHTNVMMAIGSQVAIVCLDCIPDQQERSTLRQSLETYHHVVEITREQIESFAGNMLALKNNRGEELMVMSSRAYESLSDQQRKDISLYARIVHAPINTIENVGGGSARCMIAEVFLPAR